MSVYFFIKILTQSQYVLNLEKIIKIKKIKCLITIKIKKIKFLITIFKFLKKILFFVNVKLKQLG